MLDKSLKLPLRLTCCLAMLLIAGCAEDTITSAIPVAERALQPDRTLVHRFQVVPDYVESSRLERDKVQTEEEIRVGKILAEPLAKNLVDELRSYGINAVLAREGAPPEDKTITIFGQFMHIEERGRSNVVVGFAFGDLLRTRILIFQGSGSYYQFIAQLDSTTQTALKSGMAPMEEKTPAIGAGTRGDGGSDKSRVANETFFSTVESDAKRAAKELAERIANNYRKRGWLKP
jgi:hypothetical protein